MTDSLSFNRDGLEASAFPPLSSSQGLTEDMLIEVWLCFHCSSPIVDEVTVVSRPSQEPSYAPHGHPIFLPDKQSRKDWGDIPNQGSSRSYSEIIRRSFREGFSEDVVSLGAKSRRSSIIQTYHSRFQTDLRTGPSNQDMFPFAFCVGIIRQVAVTVYIDQYYCELSFSICTVRWFCLCELCSFI